jgi:uncharacterized membrane protein
MLRFLKTTVLGGILFLVPIIIFIAIIGKTIPVAGLLVADKFVGVAVAELVAIALLVLICFIAGLAARTPRAKKIVQSLEVNVLQKIPVYELLKTKAQSALSF